MSNLRRPCSPPASRWKVLGDARRLENAGLVGDEFVGVARAEEERGRQSGDLPGPECRVVGTQIGDLDIDLQMRPGSRLDLRPRRRRRRSTLITRWGIRAERLSHSVP